MSNHPHPDDDPIARLLRAHAPPPVVDDGFTERTMRAIPDIAPTRMAAARALVLEQHRYARQARLWRWAMAGVGFGTVLAVAAIASSPGGLALDVPVSPTAPDWLPLSALLVAGSFWYAWSEFRKS